MGIEIWEIARVSRGLSESCREGKSEREGERGGRRSRKG